MFDKIKKKIDSKKGSKNPFWISLYWSKYLLWWSVSKINKNKFVKERVKKENLKILYIYDFKDWALHNVGKLWLNNQDNIKTTFISFEESKKEDFSKYDFIWFSYLDLFLETPYDINKSIISIHDPMELFASKKNWKRTFLIFSKEEYKFYKKRKKVINLLRNSNNLVVTSIEMKNMLKKYNLKSKILITNSLLKKRDLRSIKTNKCEIISVLREYKRKNIPLLNSIIKECNKLNIKFDSKIGKIILPEKEYLKLLDKHEIYICTSYQEGGPLPAFDAMKRGCVILTTPVGQIQEIIENGKNGFICKNKKEFIKKIIILKNNPKLLNKLRKNSLKTILKKRNDKIIKSKVRKFLASLN
ncbi:MAG: glycosyltransferase [Candidatus Pacearchaeota archaeon]|jgi:glycosyltransferase involved in cell wall biosynthesis